MAMDNNRLLYYYYVHNHTQSDLYLLILFFMQLVTEQVKTWSEKICRSIWRYHIIAHSYEPRLKALEVDQTNMITLLDLSHFRVPENADSSWLLLAKT